MLEALRLVNQGFYKPPLQAVLTAKWWVIDFSLHNIGGAQLLFYHAPVSLFHYIYGYRKNVLIRMEVKAG